MKAIHQHTPIEPFVCVVDGDPAVRESLKYLCDSNGYQAVGFATRDALLRSLDLDVRARCVICEAQLPDANGVDLFVELRERGVAVPFALMVSRMSLLSTRRATRVGIETVWRKPILDRSPLISFLAIQ